MATVKRVRRERRPRSAVSDCKKLKLLVTVVNRRKTEFYLDFLSGFECNLQLALQAEGTAHSEMLHMLGLEDEEKSVIFSILREDLAERALHGLEDKFAHVRGGKGIAFTVPLTSVMGVALYRFLSNDKTVPTEEKVQ